MLLDLFEHIQEHIVSYCSVTDLKQLSLTSSACYNLVQQQLYHTQRISPEVLKESLTDEKLNILQRARVLRFTSTQRFKLPCRSYEFLAQLTNLRHLELLNCTILDWKLAIICNGLRSLKVLHVSYCNITDKGVEHLKQLTLLEELYLGSSRITVEGLKHIPALVNLVKLDLSYGSGVDDACFEHIALLMKLEVLVLHQCVNVTSLSRISTIQTLKFLDLSDCRQLSQLDEAIFSECTPFSRLESLILTNCNGMFVGTDIAVGVAQIASNGSLRNLRRLDISSFPIDDATFLSIIRHLPNLKHLRISRTAGFMRDPMTCVSDEAIAQVAENSVQITWNPEKWDICICMYAYAYNAATIAYRAVFF